MTVPAPCGSCRRGPYPTRRLSYHPERNPVTNLPLLAQTREIILRQPDRHTQWLWLSPEADGARASDVAAKLLTPIPLAPEDPDNPICMTTGCVAGIAALLSAPEGAYVTASGGSGYLVLPPDTDHPTGAKHDVEYWAEDALGLTGEQALWMFSGDRTREAVLDGLAYLQANPDATFAELDAQCAGSERDEDDEWDGEDQDWSEDA